MNNLPIEGDKPVHPAVERARERARRKERRRRQGFLWDFAYLFVEALAWLVSVIKWW